MTQPIKDDLSTEWSDEDLIAVLRDPTRLFAVPGDPQVEEFLGSMTDGTVNIPVEEPPSNLPPEMIEFRDKLRGLGWRNPDWMCADLARFRKEEKENDQ